MRAIHHVDWNVMAILVGIWIIAGYFGKSGVPSWLSMQALKLSGGRPGYLVFMASHGRRGISGALLGSETQKLLTHSKIPVLVYR